MRHTIALLMLALAACGTSTDFKSPASISLTRHLIFSDQSEIGKKANAHCAQFNKDAELTSRQPDASGYLEHMTFKCVAR